MVAAGVWGAGGDDLELVLRAVDVRVAASRERVVVDGEPDETG